MPDLPDALAEWRDRYGLKVSLPTEAQWEMGARGKESRIYPCGNTLDADTANYRDTEIGGTSPVGCFIKDKSFYDLQDMTGNVLEWCLDGTRKYTKKVVENPTGPMDKDGGRVVRGGSWHYSAWFCRAANRYADHPGSRYVSLGFRLVLPGQ